MRAPIYPGLSSIFDFATSNPANPSLGPAIGAEAGTTKLLA